MNARGVAVLLFPVLVWLPQGAGAQEADPVRTVDAFHAALEAGDRAHALALLAEDAVVLEAGGVESRADYAAHHLDADIAFARAVRTTRTRPVIVIEGGTAWAHATSSAKGTFKGRAVDTRGAELMVLTRTPGGWRIRAVHWSSRPAARN